MILKSPTHSFVLRFRHPSIPSSAITEQQKLAPERQWTSGERRNTPKGTLLEGYRTETYWTASVLPKRSTVLFERVAILVKKLARHRAWLDQFVEEGGTIEIYLQLNGSQNAGDTLRPALLRAMADLHIDLSIEVFPH